MSPNVLRCTFNDHTANQGLQKPFFGPFFTPPPRRNAGKKNPNRAEKNNGGTLGGYVLKHLKKREAVTMGVSK